MVLEVGGVANELFGKLNFCPPRSRYNRRMPNTHPIHARPFLKWAGGKGRLLAQYERFFPHKPMRGYYEPFVGSGAVFFHLRPRELFSHYRLSDSNAELITCYRVVRDELDALLTHLAEHQARHSKAHYYDVRAWDRDPAWAETPEVKRAARLIYLNKTCYNGLWRVNSRGQFNVPMGRYRNPPILDEPRLRAASAALQGVELAVADFGDILGRAGNGDFVYFDPPYHPLSATANFTAYSGDGFGEEAQRRLARVFAALAERGAWVLLSNSDTPFVRALYGAFRIQAVQARRAINAAAHKRGAVGEVLVLSLPTRPPRAAPSCATC